MSNYPLTKFTLLFILGIIIESSLEVNPQLLLIVFTITVLLLLIFQVIHNLRRIDKTFLILFAIMLFGAAYVKIYTLNPVKYPFEKPKYKNATLIGEVNKIELIRDGRISFQLYTDTVYTENKKYIGSFSIITSIYDSNSSLKPFYEKLNIGNRIKIQASLQRPRNQRNPFEFDYEKYLNTRNIVGLASCYEVKKIQIVSQGSAYAKTVVFKIRKYLDEIISSIHNKTTASMLRGLILADRSGIDAQINQDFINAGVVHVLSVSGLHVGYIVIIFLFLFSRMNLYWRVILTITGLFIYMVITGSEAPVFRATVMASVIMLAPMFGRDSNSYNTLALAAIIILLLNPVELFNPSFQLSFSAILSLIILFPHVKRYVDGKLLESKKIKYLLMFFGSTLAAQIGTLPFTLVYFGKVSITSLFANFFVIPISGLIVGLGIVSIIFFHLSYWIASVFSSCNELLTYIMLSLVQLFGNPKYSFITINQFSLYDSVLFYSCLGIILSQISRFRKKSLKIIFVSLMFMVFVVYSRLDNNEMLPSNKLSVLFIDVGQGESILIKFPNQKTALIDAGDANERFDNGKRIIAPLLDKLGISKIDYGFVSHVDADHYLGFISLIKEGRVKRIFKPMLDSTEVKDQKFETVLKKMNIPISYYHQEIISLGNSRIYVLNNSEKEKSKISTNDKSGMLKLVYGSSSILFTGDASISVEKEYILMYGKFIKSEIIKIGHHGSSTSTSERFLETVKPKFGVISAGIMNKFKHPSRKILERLSEHKIYTLRTDLAGAILFRSDGTKLQLIDWKTK